MIKNWASVCIEAPADPNALAGFQYLVEHGHPYEGKAAELPLAPATC